MRTGARIWPPRGRSGHVCVDRAARLRSSPGRCRPGTAFRCSSRWPSREATCRRRGRIRLRNAMLVVVLHASGDSALVADVNADSDRRAEVEVSHVDPRASGAATRTSRQPSSPHASPAAANDQDETSGTTRTDRGACGHDPNRAGTSMRPASPPAATDTTPSPSGTPPSEPGRSPPVQPQPSSSRKVRTRCS